MNPDEIHVQHPRPRHQRFRHVDVDAHLRNLAQENVARMNVNHHVCPFQIVQNLISSPFCHRSVRIAREDAVHIQIESRHTPHNRINAQWIQGGINLDRSIEQMTFRFQKLSQAIADILSLQLVAVRTGHNANPFATITGRNTIFFHQQPLIDRQVGRNYHINHIFS